MNTDAGLRSNAEIQGVVINVSFPRSGHRFLRDILSMYFEDDFVFYESYTKEITSKTGTDPAFKTVNFVKTHDFQLLGRKIFDSRFPENRRYLIQIRHPLESIASYYEFALKHGHVRQDTEAEWAVFLANNLEYWKRFCEVWLTKIQDDSLLITYDDLFASTFQAAENVIKFITGQSSLDSGKLERVISQQEFLQYVGDTESRKQNRRQLESFKYFNLNKFQRLESELYSRYLEPLGIVKLIN